MTPYDHKKIAFFQNDIENFKLNTVYLGLTDFCNHNCAWCFTRLSRRTFNAQLSEDVFLRTVQDFKELGVKGVILSGEGDPLMCPYFGRALIVLTSHFSVGLKTNGGFLCNYNVNTLSRLKFLRISLDAFTPEDHRKWHGSNDWEKIMEFIKTFPNKDILEIGSLRGDYLDMINGFTNKYNVKTMLRSLHENIRPEHVAEHCHVIRSMCHIAPNGDVMTCCSYTPLDTKYKIGNIYDEPLTDIWGSEFHRNLVKSIKPKDCPEWCIYHEKNYYYENRDKLHLEFV